MTRLSWYGYEVEIDRAATAAWYARAGEWGCGCGHCRNFLALARERRLPSEILDILDKLHIPPEKATYVCELYHDEAWTEKGLLYQFSWRVAGQILARPPGEDRGPNWGPGAGFAWGELSLGHEDYPYGAPDFPQPCFDLECDMYLPWILDEPIDGQKEEEDYGQAPLYPGDGGRAGCSQ